MEQLHSALEALKNGLEVAPRSLGSELLGAEATGPAFRAGLWASEEAGLRPERCEMLQTPGSSHPHLSRLDLWSL